MKRKKFILIILNLLLIILFISCSKKKNDGNSGANGVTGPSINNPPAVSLIADPNNGIMPLTVQFTANANDSDGSVVKYEWDFDSNGVFDSTTTGNVVNYIYTVSGTYNPKVRVTDNIGAAAEANTSVIVNGPSGLPEIISFTPSGTQVNNSVYLEQVSSNNDQIVLAVKIQGGVNVYGASLEIDFDGAKIQYISASEGNYLKQSGTGVSFNSALEQGSNGILLIGIFLQGTVPGVNGDGTLATIVFKALATQENTPLGFNSAISLLKSPVGNIPGVTWWGGALSYK